VSSLNQESWTGDLPTSAPPLRTVRLHQVRLEHELLVGGEIDFGVEGLVSRQADGNFAVAGGDDQAFGDAAKLGGVADELSVEKDGGAVGRFRELAPISPRAHTGKARLIVVPKGASKIPALAAEVVPRYGSEPQGLKPDC
jgi:hypothetical protein